MKSRTFSFSWRAVDNILSHILWAVCRYWNPHLVKEVNSMLTTSIGIIDPKLVGWWCSLPLYFMTNQSEECMWVGHTPCYSLPHSCFKKPFPEGHERVQIFWVLAAHTPCLMLAISSIFLCHNLVSVDWLYSVLASGSKFGLVTILATQFRQ